MVSIKCSGHFLEYNQQFDTLKLSFAWIIKKIISECVAVHSSVVNHWRIEPVMSCEFVWEEVHLLSPFIYFRMHVAGVQPSQAAKPSHSHTLSLELIVLNCGYKPEICEKTFARTGRTCKLHIEKSPLYDVSVNHCITIWPSRVWWNTCLLVL